MNKDLIPATFIGNPEDYIKAPKYNQQILVEPDDHSEWVHLEWMDDDYKRCYIPFSKSVVGPSREEKLDLI